MRALLIGVLVIVSTACGGGSSSPTAPTPPVAVAPPVVTPPPPPPAPTITNYAGRWAGTYTVEACSGSSGSMGDVLCSAPHGGFSGGVFQLGTAKPMSLELTQSGSTVTGILGIGQTRGNVSGSVRSDGSLFISGGTSGGEPSLGIVITTNLTGWSTSLQGNQLAGTMDFGVLVNIYPGNGTVRGRMLNVTR